MRTGSAWDLLGALAVAAPLAGLLAPLVGRDARRAGAVGRWGALAATAAWCWMLAVTARPTIGAFDPDPVAQAALAGTSLLAAALLGRPRPGSGTDPVVVLAPPAAVVLGLAVGIVDGPGGGTSAGVAVALAVGAALVAAAAVAGAGRRPALALLAPAALLVVVRAGRDLPAGELDGGLALAAPGAALAAAAAAWAPARWPALARTAAPLLVAAGALAPLGGARPAAGLLAAAAVLAVAAPARWSALALAPGLALLLEAAADVPAPGDPGATLPVWGVALAVAATGLVARATATAAVEPPARPPAAEVRAAAAVLTAWLLLGPGHWRWTGLPTGALAAWERAAAVAAAALLGAAALGAALRLAPWPDRKPDARAG